MTKKQPDEVIELFTNSKEDLEKAQKMVAELKRLDSEKSPDILELVSALRKSLIWIFALSRSADIDPINTRILAKSVDEKTGDPVVTKEISLQETIDELIKTLEKFDPLPEEFINQFKANDVEGAVEELKSFDEEKRKRIMN